MAKKKKNGNVIHFQRTARFNSAIIVFLVFFVYVIGSIIGAMKKETISIYRVSASNINNNITCTGIALREEVNVTASKSGYLCYFVRDGEKIRNNSPVCTVDETGNLLASISIGTNDKSIFSSKDYQEIRSTIDTFKVSYRDEEFFNVKNFRGTIESKILELSNDVLMSEYQLQGAAVQSTVENVRAQYSGIVSYYQDGYEEMKPETLREEDFDRSQYSKKSLKTGELINSGSALFKIIPSEKWNICCKVSKEQAMTLLAKEELTFTINNSEIEMTSKFTTIELEQSTLIVLTLSQYMGDYIDDRFLSIEFILDRYDGLKVPNTAVLEKEVYKIPGEYVTSGNNSEDENTIVLAPVTKLDGTTTVENIELKIYKREDTNNDSVFDYYYVDETTFENIGSILRPGNNKKLAVSEFEKDVISGVYFANKGISQFMMVTIVKEGDEFTIVKDNGSLREYDNIVMDHTTVNENQTIY